MTTMMKVLVDHMYCGTAPRKDPRFVTYIVSADKFELLERPP